MAGERVDLLGLQPYVHNGLEQRRIKHIREQRVALLRRMIAA